jgi:hypothetical protein
MTVQIKRLDLPPPFLTPARERRFCEAQIDEGKVSIRNRHPRAREHAAKGLRPDQCGSPAGYEIDGHPFCAKHAGALALEVLLELMGGQSPQSPAPQLEAPPDSR